MSIHSAFRDIVGIEYCFDQELSEKSFLLGAL